LYYPLAVIFYLNNVLKVQLIVFITRHLQVFINVVMSMLFFFVLLVMVFFPMIVVLVACATAQWASISNNPACVA
jgi:hypothetical protein